MIFRSSLQLMPCRSWIGETSPNPDFVRPVEVFQGFFDIAHPCRHDESVVERSTIIQKSFEKIDRIFIEKSIRNRRNIGSAPKLREKRIRTRHGGAPGRPGSAPERARSPSGASWEGPGGAPGRPASGSAPEASSERPGSVPNRPKSPPRGPRAILHRFFVDLGSILGSIFDGFCVEFLFAWPFVCLLLRSSARSTVAVHLRFSCVLRAYEPHRQSTIPT